VAAAAGFLGALTLLAVVFGGRTGSLAAFSSRSNTSPQEGQTWVRALKVLQQRLDDERERERFAREGRLAASIDHEHCVFVFGASDVQGRPAIAMELMQGTLADRLAATGPIAPGAAVDIALQLIAGLEAAAEAGILHRDVKPSNCFVDGAGVVKIGDFGISRSVRPTEETALSMRGQLTGTPTYAPPEQLRGATLDVRADIYSLGATLYELVTGRRPFVAQDLMALLMAVTLGFCRMMLVSFT